MDYLLIDSSGPVSLIENKLRITNERQLESAVEQAKSYALMLGLTSFIVAAPVGIWVYGLSGNRESLFATFDVTTIDDLHKRLPSLLS